MKNFNFLSLFPNLIKYYWPFKKSHSPFSTLSKNVKIIDDFYSPQLNNKRRILVYLPPSYGTSPLKRYPVLYMHDGNNLFDRSTSYVGIEWAMDKKANMLIRENAIKSVIIVGIYNNRNRDYEYTPVFDDKLEEGGLGNLYLQFITETLKPWVDKSFRTIPNRDNTGIGGSSLGGLISLYGAIKYQKVFGFAASISPSLWWANGFIFDFVRKENINHPLNIWLDMGTNEGIKNRIRTSINPNMLNCRIMAEILKKHENVKYLYTEYPGACHNEKSWGERTGDILEYFFGY